MAQEALDRPLTGGDQRSQPGTTNALFRSNPPVEDLLREASSFEREWHECVTAPCWRLLDEDGHFFGYECPECGFEVISKDGGVPYAPTLHLGMRSHLATHARQSIPRTIQEV